MLDETSDGVMTSTLYRITLAALALCGGVLIVTILLASIVSTYHF